VPIYNIDGELKPVEEGDEDSSAPVHTRNNFMDEGGHAVWLKHIREGRKIPPVPDISLYNAVMGSTAAPTYFPCHHFSADLNDGRGKKQITAIDGSIFDNPCISYHGAIRQHLEQEDGAVMILLGTGYTLKSISKEQWNSYGNLGVVDPLNDMPLINILFHAPESALTQSFFEELEERLYLFNKSMISMAPGVKKPSAQIDDAGIGNMQALKGFAEALIEEEADSMDSLCNLLVHNYEERQRALKTEVKDSRKWFSWLGD
jgi:patatin-like phospholipase/acyl hydrolase